MARRGGVVVVAARSRGRRCGDGYEAGGRTGRVVVVVVVVGGGDTNASVRPRLRLRGVLRCCCSAASSVRLWTRASLLLT